MGLFQSVADSIKHMRYTGTAAEEKLWDVLKGRQVNGLRFRRQVTVHGRFHQPRRRDRHRNLRRWRTPRTGEGRAHRTIWLPPAGVQRGGRARKPGVGDGPDPGGGQAASSVAGPNNTEFTTAKRRESCKGLAPFACTRMTVEGHSCRLLVGSIPHRRVAGNDGVACSTT